MRIHRRSLLSARHGKLARMGQAAVLSLASALCASAPAQAWQLGVGRSVRPDNLDLSLGSGWWRVEYIDEGRQPMGIRNRNRLLDVDGVLQGGILLSWFVEAGLSSALWSINGSGNGYQAPRGFVGYNVGGGLQWSLAPALSLRLQMLRLHYPQSSQPGSETFEYTSLGLVLDW